VLFHLDFIRLGYFLKQPVKESSHASYKKVKLERLPSPTSEKTKSSTSGTSTAEKETENEKADIPRFRQGEI